jgi:hypothetical protein
MPAQDCLRAHQQGTPGRSWQLSRERRQDHPIGRPEVPVLDGPPQNAQLVAKEKEFNLMIDTIELEHEHINEEAQAAVDAGEDQERRAW